METSHSGNREEGTCSKQNCWEITRCGLELGGSRVDEMGVCPAALPTGTRHEGANRGLHAGRVCWAIEGTKCDCTKGIASARFLACIECEVLKRVQDEEGPSFEFGMG